MSRVRSALEVVEGRGWFGKWVAEREWGPRLEAEQDGVVAGEACLNRSENHPKGRRARTAGSEMGESAGSGETAETGGGGRKGRNRRGTHPRRHLKTGKTGWEGRRRG